MYPNLDRKKLFEVGERVRIRTTLIPADGSNQPVFAHGTVVELTTSVHMVKVEVTDGPEHMVGHVGTWMPDVLDRVALEE